MPSAACGAGQDHGLLRLGVEKTVSALHRLSEDRCRRGGNPHRPHGPGRGGEAPPPVGREGGPDYPQHGGPGLRRQGHLYLPHQGPEPLRPHGAVRHHLCRVYHRTAADGNSGGAAVLHRPGLPEDGDARPLPVKLERCGRIYRLVLRPVLRHGIRRQAAFWRNQFTIRRRHGALRGRASAVCPEP